MKRKARSMTEVLRRAIAESGMAYIALARATGVQRASIQRFVCGGQSLRLDVADKLAAFFGLELRPGKRKGR
jgi:plasmid maintenance system antidote protein VapI